MSYLTTTSDNRKEMQNLQKQQPPSNLKTTPPNRRLYAKQIY